MYRFTRKPKHVGAVLLILKCFDNSAFFNVVCISLKTKCWMLLMHGVSMKFTSSNILTILSFAIHIGPASVTADFCRG